MIGALSREHLIWLIMGILLGWVVEWLLDRWVLRRRQDKMKQEVEILHAKLLEAEQINESYQSSLDHASRQIGLLKGKIHRLQMDASKKTVTNEGDAADPAEASDANQQLQQEVATLRTQLEAAGDGTANPQASEQLNLAKHEIADLHKRLSDHAGTTAILEADNLALREQLLQVDVPLGSDSAEFGHMGASELGEKVQRLEADNEQLRQLVSVLQQKRKSEQVSAEKTLSQRVDSANDNLTRIRGIGPAFARRLNQAGIHTFADLTAVSAEKLKEIVKVQPWQKISPEDWIIEAETLIT